MKYISLIIIFLLSISMVSAASFVSPEPMDTIKGSYDFLIKAVYEDLNKCTINAESLEAEDSHTILLYADADSRYASTLFDTTILKDASDWKFSGKCSYKDGVVEPVEPLTDVTVDNTIPSLQVMSFEEDSEYWDFYCVGANTASVEIGGQVYYFWFS